MEDKIQVLLDKKTISEKVKALAAEINRDYRDLDPIVVGVLNGAFVFMADLVRELVIPLTIEFIRTSSYRSGTETTGCVQLVSDIQRDIKGRHILIVEDIIDTGLTLTKVKELFLQRGASSVRICALLFKPDRARVVIETAYRGFTIPDLFVVGYGLDHNGAYRNLPYIGYIEGQPGK